MKVRYLLTSGLLAMGLIAAPLLPLASADDAPSTKAAEKTKQPAKEKEEAKSYWLGVQLAPTPEILMRHVERLKDGAAMVAGVAPDSPAEKAGLLAEDLILKVNDTAVTSPEQVVEAVKSSEGKALTVRVLRGMDIESLTVTPEVAPENAPKMPEMGLMGMPGMREMQLPPNGARMRFFGPGQMVPQQMQIQLMEEGLPQNLMIRVEQQGDQPANIHIERDGKKWDVTAEELDKLPEDLRPIAKRYLGKGGNGPIIVGGGDVPMKDIQIMLKEMKTPVRQFEAAPGMIPPQMQRDIQEMREMMKQMREQMQKIQPQQPAAPAQEANEV